MRSDINNSQGADSTPAEYVSNEKLIKKAHKSCQLTYRLPHDRAVYQKTVCSNNAV
jgi:hypothetical protein